MKTILALYHFCPLKNLASKKKELLALGAAHDIRGTLLIANEGINGTISFDDEKCDTVIANIEKICKINCFDYKTSRVDCHPFHRYKVKIKKEIVTMGCDVDPANKTGTYVEATDWNELISRNDVLLIDTRNDYEYAIGTFKGSINPHTNNFREFPAFIDTYLRGKKQTKVAMFCTGGIRCEKATSYLKQQDFEHIYHLKGGILKYLEIIPEKESLWEGECFVFDQRVTVRHGLTAGLYEQCHACRMPITESEKSSIYFEQGISCPHCYHSLTQDKHTRLTERQKQIQIAKNSGVQHIGQVLCSTQN